MEAFTQRISVDSSVMKSIVYDPFSRILEIEFIDGDRYLYFRVPKSVYTSLLGAESRGRYFHQEIKDVFPFRKVDERRTLSRNHTSAVQRASQR